MPSIGLALWRARAMAAAPTAPYWLVSAVAAFVADERADTDALLLLADALDVAARAAAAGGVPWSRALHHLAELPRQRADDVRTARPSDDVRTARPSDDVRTARPSDDVRP